MTRLADAVKELFFRAAASGAIPARPFQPPIPPPDARAARTGRLTVEIVSHCWKYHHLLAYQLSSLVLHPPASVAVRMTVFYSPEDEGTAALLRFFQDQSVANVTWNWRPLDRTRLMRRSIGRNIAARESEADWIWFTDCDVVFHEGALDSLASELQGRRDALVHPREEWVTPLLPETDAMLHAARTEPRLVEVDRSRFAPRQLSEATGPMQISHGDVARAAGYCSTIPVYQKPAERWRKAHEDRAYRWLLGTTGIALPIPAVFRIRHLAKGRYGTSGVAWTVRSRLRRLQSWWRDPAPR